MKIRTFPDFVSQLHFGLQTGSTGFVGFQDLWGGFADFSRGHETSRTTSELRNGVISTLRRFPIEEFALDTPEKFLQPHAADRSPKIPKILEFRPKSIIYLVCPDRLNLRGDIGISSRIMIKKLSPYSIRVVLAIFYLGTIANNQGKRHGASPHSQTQKIFQKPGNFGQIDHFCGLAFELCQQLGNLL